MRRSDLRIGDRIATPGSIDDPALYGTRRFRIVELFALSLAAGALVWVVSSLMWGAIVGGGIFLIRAVWLWLASRQRSGGTGQSHA